MRKVKIIILLLLVFVSFKVFAKQKVETTEKVKKPLIMTFCDKKSDICKMQYITLNDIKKEYSKDFDFVEIDSNDEDKDFYNLKAKYNVTTIPTTVFINYETNSTKKVGEFLPYELYLKYIEKMTK